jgi:hypothetical protein
MSEYQNEINGQLIPMGFIPMGKCSCRGKPFRWKMRSYEFKLWNNEEWKFYLGGNLIRYGHAKTAIEEVKDYFEKQMVQAKNEAWS